MIHPMRIATLALALLSAPVSAQVDLAPFLRDNDFDDIKLSPTGEYLAATVPFPDRTALVVMKRGETTRPLSRFALGKDTHVGSFHWVNKSRLVLSMSEKFGQLDTPQGTGELFAVDADGSKPEMLVGYRVTSDSSTRVGGKQAEAVAAFLVDDLPGDDRHVLISVSPFSREPMTRVEKMDVYTGRRARASPAPASSPTMRASCASRLAPGPTTTASCSTARTRSPTGCWSTTRR
jgi:hypothetical protein